MLFVTSFNVPSSCIPINIRGNTNINIPQIKDILYNSESLSGMYFFSAEEYQRANRLTIDYLKELEKIQSEAVKEEKPYYVLSLTLPIKQVIENQAMK